MNGWVSSAALMPRKASICPPKPLYLLDVAFGHYLIVGLIYGQDLASNRFQCVLGTSKLLPSQFKLFFDAGHKTTIARPFLVPTGIPNSAHHLTFTWLKNSIHNCISGELARTTRTSNPYLRFTTLRDAILY